MKIAAIALALVSATAADPVFRDNSAAWLSSPPVCELYSEHIRGGESITFVFPSRFEPAAILENGSVFSLNELPEGSEVVFFAQLLRNPSSIVDEQGRHALQVGIAAARDEFNLLNHDRNFSFDPMAVSLTKVTDDGMIEMMMVCSPESLRDRL
jgi:hypothetical protein